MKNMFKGLFAALLLLSAANFAQADPSGYYMLQPLSWKGNVKIKMSGMLGASGLSEVMSNHIVGLFNYNQDIYVGMGYIPVKRPDKYVFRDEYAEVIYYVSTGEFTYYDSYGAYTLAVLTFNAADNMYYANDLAQCTSTIKSQGTIYDPVSPFFSEGYGITLYNSDESKPFAVSDSTVKVEDYGATFKYNGYPYPGTKVKVKINKRTGKINIKYKTNCKDSNNPYASLQPSLMWWVEEAASE